jgi:hypothetical protein
MVGYMEKDVFRAPLSSGTVAHFITTRWLNWFGRYEAVEVSVNPRHHDAQAFPGKMFLRFIHPPMTEVLKIGPTDSPIQFSQGRLCA